MQHSGRCHWSPGSVLIGCAHLYHLVRVTVATDAVGNGGGCHQAAFHGLTSASRGAEGAPGRSVLVSKPRSGAPTVAPQITCADILFALEDMPAGGLTPALLGEFAATHDRSSSEASFVIV